MRRLSLVALALALLSTPAQAILGNYGGYVYPTNVGGPVCTPSCAKISAEWIVPTSTDSGTGGTQITVHWIGVTSRTNTNGGANFHCPGNTCLGQFGTQSAWSGGVASYRAWYELACNFSPCFSITYIDDTTYPTHAADHIIATMQCTSNCVDNGTGQTWRLTLQNVTAGWTWNNNNTDFNWQLAVDVASAYFMVEAPSSGVKPDNFGTIHFANVKGNDALLNLNLGAPEKMDTTNGGNRTMYPSFPMGPAGGSFNVCYAVGTYAAAPVCPGGGMSGSTKTVGP